MRRFLSRRNILIIFVLLLPAVGWWWNKRSVQTKALLGRRVVVVERKDVTSSLTVSGRVDARKLARLNFLTSGKLAFVRVEEGDQVKAGEWLMGLDTGDLKAVETKAWYSYLAADANAKEVEDSLKGRDTNETFSQKNRRVAAQTARDSAYESWLAARRAVDNSVLKAPFAGVVVEVTLRSAGGIVGVSDGVTIADPKSFYFEAEIDESDLGKVFEGQEVIVTLDAFGGETIRGRLSHIGLVSRLSATGANVYPARVDFLEGVVDKLRLGMNGDAKIILERRGGVISVPIEAVDNGVVEKEGGEKVKVETGLESDSDIEIKSGLEEGDRIVVR